MKVKAEMSKNYDILFSMAQTKQTARKQSPKQGTPAKFPKRGKPTGKAGKHLALATDESSLSESSETDRDNNNNENTVKATVNAGRKRRNFAEKHGCIRGR